jgi:hypothetical protein
MTNVEQPGSGKKRKRTEVRSNAETEEVSMIAKKFTIMSLLWLRDDRKTFQTAIDEQYDHLQRFKNKETKIQGQLADIVEVLPSRYVGALCNNATWLSQMVRSSL